MCASGRSKFERFRSPRPPRSLRWRCFIDMTQLDRLQKSASEFLDDFSHEVRTPLAGLRSAVETLRAAGLSAEKEEKLRQVMRAPARDGSNDSSRRSRS